VQLAGLPEAQQAAVLSLDIGDVVRTYYTPNKVAEPIDRYGIVEGLSHVLGPRSHVVTVSLSDIDSRTFFILDDAAFGLLDGPGVLGLF
jgi:hypothetical protein